MRNYQNIALIVVAALVATFIVSCNNPADSVLTSQQNAIASYLKGQHQPKLMPEEEVPNSLDEFPQFYTQWGLNLYRYIATYYDEGRDQRPEVTMGSTVDITYTAYIFTSGKPSSSAIYATNDAESLAIIESSGLNTSYEWTTDPYVIKMGESDLVEGLEIALQECREGDDVEIYMTFDMAYGNDYIGIVPSKSAVMWDIHINSVK